MRGTKNVGSSIWPYEPISRRWLLGDWDGNDQIEKTSRDAHPAGLEDQLQHNSGRKMDTNPRGPTSNVEEETRSQESLKAQQILPQVKLKDVKRSEH